MNKFNFHITNQCNFCCKYCFGKFEADTPSLDDAKRIIDSIKDYFDAEKIQNGTINLAGGEPLLYPKLDEVIDYAVKTGIAVSLITNGSLLTSERIRSWQGKVSCIGLSIDSVIQETCRTIGRTSKNQVIPLSAWTVLAKEIHACGMRLKVNTVVSKYNCAEDLTPLYTALKADRIKLLQMHHVKGINDSAADAQISADEFQAFCERHRPKKESGIEFVTEKIGEMENAYLMIDPKGDLLLNNQGEYKTIGNCLHESLRALISKTDIDQAKYARRYSGGEEHDS